jgi:hypothetical protein
MDGRGLERLALALAVVGAGLMLAFDVTLTRILGVMALLGFIALGLFVVANPGYLSEDESADRDDTEGRV